MRSGDAVYLDRNGRCITRPAYSRWEQIVRAAGRVLRIRRAAHYHEQVPIGIALNSAPKGGIVRVATHGTLTINPDNYRNP